MTIKAAFFDIDGTLVDSNEFHVSAWERAFQQSSFPVDPAAIRRQIGKGADMLLPALAQELKVLLASSAKQTEVDHYVDLLDVRGLISGTASGDDVARTKPAGDIFLSALSKVAPIIAAEVVAIGDTPFDAAAARKVEIKTIAVRSGGFPDSSLTDAGAVSIHDSVGDLFLHLKDSMFHSTRH
jgi:phosphoglycolate phosphatase-like HAD superfamily hydrolase